MEYNLKNKTDEELVTEYRNGDKAAFDVLYNRFRHYVKARSRGYFLIGAELEDLVQEGMIGFVKAVKDYSRNKNTSFSTFLYRCVDCQLKTAVKASLRKKHTPLNEAVYIDAEVCGADDEENIRFVDMLVSNILDPEVIVSQRDEYESTMQRIRAHLTDIEYKVLQYYLQGYPYNGIAKAVNVSEKSVDNALQRIKTKLSPILDSGEDNEKRRRK